MAGTESLDRIFKAYDVRGVVPSDLDRRRAFAIGFAFARFAKERDGDVPVVVAHDMRTTGDELAAAFGAGVEDAGGAQCAIGLASTDLLYFASGRRPGPGAMLTASHNPSEWNGIKFCLSGARPVAQDSGLADIKAVAEERLASVPADVDARPAALDPRDWIGEFADHVRSFVDVKALKPLAVVADTANGMGGLVAPAVFSELPGSLDLLYADLDGTFPNHPANPIDPENLADLQARITLTGADVGLAFDGDADRVFLVDESGGPLSGSTTTAIVASSILDKNPGATVLYNLICSRAVPEVIAEHGGVGIRTRVGHSFIKAEMALTNAVFAGEHSGHYYFRDNYRADSGIIAAMFVLEALSTADVPLSELRRPFERYADSGEINTRVDDPEATIASVEEKYADAGAVVDHLDGLTVEFGEWWFNLRPSNTEPLLRLNVEADNEAALGQRVAEVLEFVRGHKSEG
ncbi:MAG: phosphomannomutase/phosphoglucomutase [Acidimicrobiales bacterium]